jgi:hypothetical protein
VAADNPGTAGSTLAIIWSAAITSCAAAFGSFMLFITRRKNSKIKENSNLTGIFVGGTEKLLDRYEHDRQVQSDRIAALEKEKEELQKALDLEREKHRGR